MRTARVALVIFCLSAGLVAQSARTQTASVHMPAGSKPATDSAAPATDRPSLDATMFDLQRVTVATDSDIADLDVEKWKSGWRTAWLKNGAHKQQAQQVAESLQRNLHDAMPGLISDVQTSRGSVSTTFKLYNDLSVVVESLDALVAQTRAYGKKGESGPLANDYAALSRIRQDVSSYIQVTAASQEPKTKAPNSEEPPGTMLPKKAATRPGKKKTAALDH
ncbi:MAG TPA: hypothetical protein VI488_00620 [Candidatus Angelobacter sp.]